MTYLRDSNEVLMYKLVADISIFEHPLRGACHPFSHSTLLDEG
jgi:hypothetical protein